MPSISVLTSFTLVCDSKRGFGSLMLKHANQTFANVVAGNRRVLLLHQIVRARVLIDRLRQRGAKSGQMRSAVRVRNGIGETQNLIVVAVVILQDAIDKNFVALPRNIDRLGMNDLLVLAQLPDEFLNAVFVEKRLLFRRIVALVDERDFKAGIQESQFAQSRGQPLEFELGRDGENRRVGQERDQRAGVLLVFDFADDAEFLGRFAALERHVVDLAVARDFDLEPIRERVDAFRADAVQAAGIFVSALAEFSARVQICQDQLHRRHFPFRMNVDRNAAAVVAHGNGTIDVHGDFDFGAIAGEMFVD